MIRGGWLQLTGRILKCLTLRAYHQVIPYTPDWPVEFQIDFHLDIPHAIAYAAVDKYNRYFVCDETWQNLTNEEIADDIVRHKNKNVWNLRRVR